MYGFVEINVWSLPYAEYGYDYYMHVVYTFTEVKLIPLMYERYWMVEVDDIRGKDMCGATNKTIFHYYDSRLNDTEIDSWKCFYFFLV